MSLSEEQHIELKIQRGIRQREDDLVTWIESALDKKQTYRNLEESQFRNVVRVAETTDSAEVIKNFLRYQMGRDNKWGRGKNSLGESIINDIDKNLRIASETIAKEAQATDTAKGKSIHIELIRRYLGYGARYLKYLNSLDSRQ